MFVSTHGITARPTAMAALLLDTYSGAAVAYSAARRLRTAYTGSLIRVRRSSDNAEQDIGYNANNLLDESALTTFVGANNGFVTTWYDQSGNAKNTTQATAANQPRIVSSGTVIKRLGKPSINFGYSNINTNLKNTSLTFNASDICIVGVANKDSSSVSSFTYSRLVSLGSTGNDYDNSNSIASFIAQTSFGGFNPALATYSNGGGVFRSYTYNNEIIFWNQKNNSLSLQYIGKNGDTLSNAAVSGGNITATKLAIGGAINDTADSYLNGYTPEIIIYTSNKVSDRTGIEGNINTFYGVY